jgi:hypothetical protein
LESVLRGFDFQDPKSLLLEEGNTPRSYSTLDNTYSSLDEELD